MDFDDFRNEFLESMRTFDLTDKSISTATMGTEVSLKTNDSSVSYKIPEWIKNNAQFWVNDQIDDGTFISGIQFLIKNGILDVPVTDEISQEQSNEIPSWIKSNADFWTQGLISDDDFLSGIEYLIKQGIIIV